MEEYRKYLILMRIIQKQKKSPPEGMGGRRGVAGLFI